MLEVVNLKKKYGEKEVLNDISFNVDEGEIVGLLGPNGAGKSTTIKILSTGLKATEGKVKYKDKDIMTNKKNYKSKIGIVPQSLAIFEELSAIENVKIFGGFYGLKGKELNERAEKVLEFVELLDRANDLSKTYSGGMKRRLNIACGLIHEPELLILDEPTVGIDPHSRNHILESVKKLRDNGTTVIYTTHYMEEVEAICDRAIIVDQGNVIAQGTLEELRSNVEENDVYTIKGIGLEKVNTQSLLAIEGVDSINLKEELEVSTTKNANNLDKIIQELINQKVKIKCVTTKDQNLETVFLNLTGRTLRD